MFSYTCLNPIANVGLDLFSLAPREPDENHRVAVQHGGAEFGSRHLFTWTLSPRILFTSRIQALLR